jgi:hypothetical protein
MLFMSNVDEGVSVNEMKAGTCEITMTDLRGRIVYSGSFVGPSLYGIDTRSMSRGIYFITVRNGAQMVSDKVLLK